MIQACYWNNYYSRIWPRAYFKEVPRFIQRSSIFVSVLTCVRISKNWSRVDLNARVNTNCQSGQSRHIIYANVVHCSGDQLRSKENKIIIIIITVSKCFQKGKILFRSARSAENICIFCISSTAKVEHPTEAMLPVGRVWFGEKRTIATGGGANTMGNDERPYRNAWRTRMRTFFNKRFPMRVYRAVRVTRITRRLVVVTDGLAVSRRLIFQRDRTYSRS